MANSVDPDQTAPIGAVCSGSTLFASIQFVSNVRQFFAADDFSRRHFQMHFFLGALRVKNSENPDKLASAFDSTKNWTNNLCTNDNFFGLLFYFSVNSYGHVENNR